jgi:hypothetical protein
MEKNKKLTALACQSDDVEAPQHLGRELHAALFPEE